MRTESAQHQIVMLFYCAEILAQQKWEQRSTLHTAANVEWAEEFPYRGIAPWAKPIRFCLISVPCRLMTPFIDSQALNPRFKRGAGYA
jgi:hypothetical protein